ncbi:MAG: endo-1,4-beta-xylanase, partial [Planctomycetota bacterium]
PTPAAEAYRDLIFHQWWTRWEGRADKDGYCRIPAFFGKHCVMADGSEKTVYLKKSEGKETVSFR